MDSAEYTSLKGLAPCIVWLTGISGAGKSSVARHVQAQLRALNHPTFLLDGDDLRRGLNQDLGFTKSDRIESTRRVAEVAKLMTEAGLIVIVALISPYRSAREAARSLVPAGKFFEIYVDTPIEIAEARDLKGLYRKARHGEIRNFTGIDSPYEAPQQPELRLDGTGPSADALAAQVIQLLRRTIFTGTLRKHDI